MTVNDFLWENKIRRIAYSAILRVIFSVSKLRRLSGFELKLQFVRNQGDELRIGGLTFGVGNCVAEKSLQGIQIAAIPSYLNGMADGTLDATGGGLEGLCDLRIQYLCNGISLPGGKQGVNRGKSMV